MLPAGLVAPRFMNAHSSGSWNKPKGTSLKFIDSLPAVTTYFEVANPGLRAKGHKQQMAGVELKDVLITLIEWIAIQEAYTEKTSSSPEFIRSSLYAK